MAIDFLFFRNFARIEDIRRRYNQMVDLPKLIFSRKILSKVVA